MSDGKQICSRLMFRNEDADERQLLYNIDEGEGLLVDTYGGEVIYLRTNNVAWAQIERRKPTINQLMKKALLVEMLKYSPEYKKWSSERLLSEDYRINFNNTGITSISYQNRGVTIKIP